MVSTGFSSVGRKSRFGLARPSFRDDAGLVALRYEKTKQAEPPVPLPPARILPRTASVTSTSWSSHSAATTRSPSSSISSSSHSPVIVAPPHGYLPAIAPPAEQHPALRSPPPAAARSLDDWKRDSGHAPTPTPSATIHEECEDDEGNRRDRDLRARLHGAAGLGRASPSLRLRAAARTSWHGSSRTADADAEKPALAGIACAAGFPPSEAGRTDPSRLPGRLARSYSFRPSGPPLSVSGSPPPPTLSALRRRQEASGVHWQARSPMRAPSANSTRHLVSHSGSHVGSQPPPPQRSLSTPDTDTDALPTSAAAQYSPLAIRIPTPSLTDDEFMAGFSFSKRGSIMLGGPRPVAPDDADAPSLSASPAPSPIASPSPPAGHTRCGNDTAAVPRPISEVRNAGAAPDIRVLSPDIEKESQKVRSLYHTGDGSSWGEDGARRSFCERLEPTPEVRPEEAASDAAPAHRTAHPATPLSAGFYAQHDGARRGTELAGGFEDWEDVDGADIDRYGFISVPRPVSRISTPTELRSSQLSPRRRNVLYKRDPMGFSSQLGGARVPSRKVSARSLNTQNSELSVASVRSSQSMIRQAGNLLPHNRNRRWMDEAGDMLTVSPSLQDVVEEAQVEKISEALKRKEWERSEKWRRMAKIQRGLDQGQGMEFDFDVRNPKLVERVWKGIPDRWRAAAWWSFLATAAKAHDGSAPTDEVAAAFYGLQQRSSPDDVQIDLDVPRTINRHIMFRRRYRGGQRLLFRVLHALSIYFPETGYVQGMASLAATLLCYFDEEKCFVMLVRMWQLRGLGRLYRLGFEGLKTALREFETVWLNKDVAHKLSELLIDTTAYGTRWYLTLFNLSIPFAAQLRVWDVFILLGTSGDDGGGGGGGAEAKSATTHKTENEAPKATSGLDVLHATSAALIQALREVLLGSDFENAMKALTSWIPIKDEDLLMKVMKAEWKLQGKKRTS